MIYSRIQLPCTTSCHSKLSVIGYAPLKVIFFVIVAAVIVVIVIDNFPNQSSISTIELIALSVNAHCSLRHSSINRVKIVGSGFRGLPALYHVSILIIAHPLADLFSVLIRACSPLSCRRFLIYVLILCHGSILHTVKPVPCST